MKVLDLRCANGHCFEGWFSADDDLASQLSRGVLTCPVCGHAEIGRVPSAPRLNLSASRAESGREARDAQADGGVLASRQRRYLEAVRHVLANTEDVGGRFAEEARKMHYNEAPERGIRGTASREEVLALADEGIEVAPLRLPGAHKQSMH